MKARTYRISDNHDQKIRDHASKNRWTIGVALEDIIDKAIKTTTKKKSIKEPVNYPWLGQGFLTAWEQWKEYKKAQHGFTYKSASTEQAALTELNKLTQDENTAIAIIHQSIGNGWKGFFQLKHNGKQQGSQLQETVRNSDLYKSL